MERGRGEERRDEGGRGGRREGREEGGEGGGRERERKGKEEGGEEGWHHCAHNQLPSRWEGRERERSVSNL